MLSEKIFFEIHLSIFCQWNIIQIKISYTKHFSGSFGITCCDDRSVDIIKSFLLKILMNGKSQFGTNPHYSPKSIGSYSQMSLFTKFLETVALWCKYSFFNFFRVCSSENCYF